MGILAKFGVFALAITIILGAGRGLYTAREQLLIDVTPFVWKNDAKESGLPILLLARYAALTRLDPVFAYPGTDTSALRNALPALRESIHLFSPSYPREEKKLIDEHLYPLNYLSTIPETEDARRAFIEHPGWIRAIRYHMALGRLMSAYIADLSGLIGALKQLPPGQLAIPTGKTSVSHFIGSIERARVDANAAREKEATRFACLFSVTSECETLTSLRTSFAQEDEPRIERVALSSDMERNRRIIEVYAKHRTSQSEEAPFSPLENFPVVTFTKPACPYALAPLAYVLWSDYARVTKIPEVLSSPINDLFFYDLARAPGPFYAAFRDRGLPYLYQQSNAYTCFDAGVDLGTSLATISIVKNAATLQSTPKLPVDVTDLINELRAFASQSALSANKAHALAVRIRHTIAKYGDRPLSTLLGEKAVTTLEEMQLEERAGSAYYELALGHVADMGEISRHVLVYQKFPLYALFLTRSYASILFSLGNHTIHPTPVTLAQKSFTEPLLDFFLLSYNRDLAKRYPQTRMEEYMQRALTVSRDLFDKNESKDSQ